MLFGVQDAQPSRDMHHIVAIRDNPQQRMARSNWLALCREHHEELEGDTLLGLQVRQWSDVNYYRLTTWSVSNV
jgi:5-methylcytosine-specific restriction endonuclease McrA